jgi:hypothetical protein
VGSESFLAKKPQAGLEIVLKLGPKSGPVGYRGHPAITSYAGSNPLGQFNETEVSPKNSGIAVPMEIDKTGADYLSRCVDILRSGLVLRRDGPHNPENAFFHQKVSPPGRNPGSVY